MQQSDLWGAVPRLEVLFELPPPEQSATKARSVSTTTGEYFIKHESWNPDINAPIVANEFLSAQLAQAIELPIPEFALVEYDGVTCFASRKVTAAYPNATSDLVQQCTNGPLFARMMMFDFWIDNRDRHEGNVLIERHRGKYRFWVIDHSHCPFPPNRKPLHLAMRHDQHGCDNAVREWARPLVVDATEVRRSIDLIQNVPASLISDIVNGCPGHSWSEADVGMIIDFLEKRRSNLRMMFNKYLSSYPSWKGGPL